MPNESSQARILGLLRELGVTTIDDRSVDRECGFPIEVVFEGGSVLLDLAEPGPLASLNPDAVGVAVVDPTGFVRRTWGLADRVPSLRAGQTITGLSLSDLLKTDTREGNASIYLDGYRYFPGRLTLPGGDDRLLLVTSAREEAQVVRLADRTGRMATALKRLGKALTMHQTMHDLCVASAHEIASAAELAAVLIWTADAEDGTLTLAASVGVNRNGTTSLNCLRSVGGTSCAAELVADTRQTFTLNNVLEHMLTMNLEAKFCYLKPGGVSVHPLVISDRLLGLLEIVGRERDPHFSESGELHQTMAEHLALALNSALMFENLEKLASHDPLTGLANHRALQEFLQQRALESERNGQSLGAIMIDVDHFRSFNEEEGHDAGDSVLKQVAESIKGCLRVYDLGARYGGEEFAVVLPGSSTQGVEMAAERIRSRVEAAPFITRSGRERHLTVSVGCAVLPDNAADGPALLKAADLALYEAKRSGRNRVVRYIGTAATDTPAPPLAMRSVRGLIPSDILEESQQRVARLDNELVWLVERLHLSPSQRTILDALLLVAPSYIRAWKTQDEICLERIESSEDARLLMPSLRALVNSESHERVPLLAKVVEVLLALDADEGRALNDPNRNFDTEIVSLLWEYGNAA